MRAWYLCLWYDNSSPRYCRKSIGTVAVECNALHCTALHCSLDMKPRNACSVMYRSWHDRCCYLHKPASTYLLIRRNRRPWYWCCDKKWLRESKSLVETQTNASRPACNILSKTGLKVIAHACLCLGWLPIWQTLAMSRSSCMLVYKSQALLKSFFPLG